MREGWIETTLGAAANITMGQSPPGSSYNSVGDGLPFIQGSAEFGPHHPSPVKWCSEPRKVARPGDVLLSVRAPVGDTNIANQEIAVGRGLAIVRGLSDLTLTSYLRVLLEHAGGSLLARSGGGMFTSITGTALKAVPVWIPSLDVQRRIVDLIGTVDAAVEAAAAARDSVRATLEARLHALFSHPPATVRFEEAASFASGSAFPNDEQGDDNGTIPFIKVSDMNLRGNEIRIINANNRVTEEGLKRLKARTWPAGTVVFPKVGAALLTEKRRVLSEPTAFDNNIMGVIARDGVTTPDFLFAFMRSVRLGQYAQIGAVPSINQGHLKALSLPKLSMDEQRAIGAEMHALDSVAAAYSLAVERLRELRSNLLTALLSGEHEIPESYDELLEVNA